MSFFIDSSKYSYSNIFDRNLSSLKWSYKARVFLNLLRTHTSNIGWLDKNHEFRKGETADDIVERLWAFCEVSIAQTRGFHICNLPGCEEHNKSRKPILATRQGITFLLGSAEIRVFGKGRKVYAAPNLIYHYVTAHEYQMPDAFVAALMTGPLPGSSEYTKRVEELGMRLTKTYQV